jgi:hypothetical protein
VFLFYWPSGETIFGSWSCIAGQQRGNSGEFIRYGLDMLVLACWRALALARADNAPEDVIQSFHRLFRTGFQNGVFKPP